MINFDLSKLSSLLNPMANQQQQSPTFPNQNPMLGQSQDMLGGDSNDQLTQALMSLLQPKEQQYDRFTQLLQSIPQKANYEPSRGRKIAAAIVGLGAGGPAAYSGGAALGYKSDIPGGLKIQSAIEDEPYNKALSNWETQSGPVLEAAKLENTRNVNSRMVGGNLMTQDRQRKDLARKEARDTELARESDVKAEQNQQKIDISNKRQQAYTFKQTHPNYKTVTREDGEMMFYNPIDPKEAPIDSGLKTQDLSDLDKIEFQHQGRMEEISARGDQQRETNAEKPETSEKGWSVQDNYDPDTGKWIGKIRVNSITGESQPIKSSKPLGPKAPPKQTPEENETQKKQGLINKANQIISSNPELKSYIVFEKNNSGNVQGVHILPRGMMGYSPFYDQDKATKAYNMLFGESKPDQTKQALTPPVAPKGYHYVRRPDDKGWTAVKDNQ